jgi:S-adenosylmethionine hydrolase
MSKIITLTTDFGLQDAFVGTMKGVILGIAPDARLVDLTHDVPPFDVRAGAYALYAAYRYFPAETIHLAVVDPGVGSARRAVAVRTSWGTFVAPDNGLLSLVLGREVVCEAVVLENPAYRLPLSSDLLQLGGRWTMSSTFHGRDVFAPAAAHIARGVPLAEFGPAASDLVTFPVSRSTRQGNALVGHVIYVDRFGNLVTDVTETDLPVLLSITPVKGDTGLAGSVVAVEAGGQRMAGLSAAYADVPPGQLLALIGSAGHLEISVREGHAARVLGLVVGDPITVILM